MWISPVAKAKSKAKHATAIGAIGATRRQTAPQSRYEAADVTSKRLSNWITPSSGPNTEIGESLVTTRNRTRALGRDNPWAKRAVQAIVVNTVGDGIRAQWADPAVQQAWDRWFSSSQMDADGLLDGYAFTALALKTTIEGGEVLVRKRQRRPEDGLEIPLQVQMLPGDRLDLDKTEALPTARGRIIHGVEFDAIGRRSSLWLFGDHPGDRLTGQWSGPSQPYAAVNFIHLFRVDYPGQVRGMPWGTASVHRLRMMDDYVEAQLQRQRASACFMAFRRTPDSTLEDISADDARLFDRLHPSAIEDLPPGWDMEFADPPDPENDASFTATRLREVAADYGIPYEVLTGDLSQVNFSSARMGFNEFARNIDTWRWQLLVPRLLDPLVAWFREAAALVGLTVRQERPLWTAPARVMVDSTREVPALIKAVRAGLMSMPQAIRQQGYDPDVLLAEEAAWRAKTAEAGVLFDTDPGADVGRDPGINADADDQGQMDAQDDQDRADDRDTDSEDDRDDPRNNP